MHVYRSGLRYYNARRTIGTERKQRKNTSGSMTTYIVKRVLLMISVSITVDSQRWDRWMRFLAAAIKGARVLCGIMNCNVYSNVQLVR